MCSMSLTEQLKSAIQAADLDVIGISSAEPFQVSGDREECIDPREIMPAARAIIIAGFCTFYPPNLVQSQPVLPRGSFPPYGSRVFNPMTSYCQQVIKQLLAKKDFQAVTSMRIPVKLAAMRAGLGAYGKNAVILTGKYGSWIMFECLITDAPLEHDDLPLQAAGCGGCDLCLKACPTGAICAPYKVDKAKCITNWLWGAFAPPALREKQENRLFGCGECLKACPRNRTVNPPTNYPTPLEKHNDNPELIPLVTADKSYFRSVVPSFPLLAGSEAIRGNAIIALGNIGDPAGVEALSVTLRSPRPRHRSYSAWSLGKIGGDRARSKLLAALAQEQDANVLSEIKAALNS